MLSRCRLPAPTESPEHTADASWSTPLPAKLPSLRPPRAFYRWRPWCPGKRHVEALRMFFLGVLAARRSSSQAEIAPPRRTTTIIIAVFLPGGKGCRGQVDRLPGPLFP